MITSEYVIKALESYLYRELIKIYDEKTVLACLDELFECLYINFKGQLMYVPTSYKVQVKELHESIYKTFTGSNHKELAIKYQRSIQNIYSIVNDVRKKQIRKLQCDIFPLLDDSEKKQTTLIILEEYLPAALNKTGLSEYDARNYSKDLSRFLCQNFPGISICISDSLRKKRKQTIQQSLF